MQTETDDKDMANARILLLAAGNTHAVAGMLTVLSATGAQRGDLAKVCKAIAETSKLLEKLEATL